MRRIIFKVFSSRLQFVLIGSFVLVAVLTIGLNALVVSRIIQQYLVDAQDRRVARDMNLAEAFYQLKFKEISAIGLRMSNDPQVLESFSAANQGSQEAIDDLDQEIIRKITVPSLDGTHLLILLNDDGGILIGRVISATGELSAPIKNGNWGSLPIIANVLETGQEQSATEVIQAQFLAQVGLEEQANIPLVDTPLASTVPYDSREGSAGLVIIGAFPIKNEMGNQLGAVAVAHLFNNDFTLVDRIKAVAGVDTATIFFGDLRVSTNVADENGQRALGTRLSQDVYDVVLNQGDEYKGEAFVVREWFITYYKPLYDYQGQVIGILYVGAQKSVFDSLVHTFNYQVELIALVSGILAGIIAVPISRFVTRPIADLVEANRSLAKGNMAVRVPVQGNGELALLGNSFNYMVETLDKTQQELLQKEKLASMGQLAAGVAHEINNPLGTILLLSGVVHKETSLEDPHRKDLEMIINEATRCKRIVADLLNFSRQQEMLTSDTDVNDLIEQIIIENTRKKEYERIEFVRSFDSDLPRIQADPAQLKQVFINLLNNSAEAISGPGKIMLSTRKLDGGMIEIRISDTGCGIAEENLSKLFTPFFTTKALGKGTGLGLSIVYGIIKMHRGYISVDSKIGEGTTFTLVLPVRHIEEQTASVNASLSRLL